MYVADLRHVPSTVFLYILHPTRPAMLREGATDAEKALAATHWTYSQELLARGVIVFAGRTMVTDEDALAMVVGGAVVLVLAPSGAVGVMDRLAGSLQDLAYYARDLLGRLLVGSRAAFS